MNLEDNKSTILSRLPILCLNNNKSIGTYDHLVIDKLYEGDEDKTYAEDVNVTISINQKSQQFIHPINWSLGAGETTGTVSTSLLASTEYLALIFDHVLNPSNMKRQLECKLNALVIDRKLNIEWLKENEAILDRSGCGEGRFLKDKNELTLAWLFHARQVLCSSVTSELVVERVLNVLSNALEANAQCEIIWLLYLSTYLCKRNAVSDYHEICLLCMDNLITYDIVWFILNTCPTEYVELIVERYEKFILKCSGADLDAFEQWHAIDYDESNYESRSMVLDKKTEDFNSSIRVSCMKRKSYYLFELIVFNTIFTMNSIKPSKEGLSSDESQRNGFNLAKDYLYK